METPTKREEPATPPRAQCEQGTPSTCAAYAERKNVSVRVTVGPGHPEPEELREEGYGHGV